MLASIRPKVILNVFPGTHSFHPKLVHEAYYSQYFPPPQAGAHLYMPVPHPKLILNVLRGTHFLQPKLVHEAYVVRIFLHPKLVPFIHACFHLPQSDIERMAHIPFTPNWYTKPMQSVFSSTPNWCWFIHACPPPESDTEHAFWRAFPSPQTGTRSLCSQYFPPPQTGAHLYILASIRPKVILNVLPGTHSLHPCPFIHGDA